MSVEEIKQMLADKLMAIGAIKDPREVLGGELLVDGLAKLQKITKNDAVNKYYDGDINDIYRIVRPSGEIAYRRVVGAAVKK